MREKSFKFKEGFANAVKGMTDKQAGEFVKGLCGYVFENKPLTTKDEYLKGIYLYAQRELDVSAMNAANGKKGAEKLAENKRAANGTRGFGVLIGNVRFSAGKAKKGNDE